MHKSELRVNPTIINRATMVYELRVGTIGILDLPFCPLSTDVNFAIKDAREG